MTPVCSKITPVEIWLLRRRRSMRPLWIGAAMIVASSLALLLLVGAETQAPTAGPVFASLILPSAP